VWRVNTLPLFVRGVLSDIPRISGLLGMIFGLIEARRNEIRSQPTRWRPK
jgi:hypothetical protein